MDNEIYLNELLSKSKDNYQTKKNKIVNALLKTEDMMKVKIISEKVMNGDFSDLKEKSIYNLIIAFEDGNFKNDNDTKINYESNEKPKDIQTELKYESELIALKEIELLRNEIQSMKNKYDALFREHNNLKSVMQITKTAELIEVSDEDINELYIDYLQNGTTNHKSAFITNGVIPKSYYKIK